MWSSVITYGAQFILTVAFCVMMIKNGLKVTENATGSKIYFAEQPKLKFPSIYLCPDKKSDNPSELPRVQDDIDVYAQTYELFDSPDEYV